MKRMNKQTKDSAGYKRINTRCVLRVRNCQDIEDEIVSHKAEHDTVIRLYSGYRKCLHCSSGKVNSVSLFFKNALNAIKSIYM